MADGHVTAPTTAAYLASVAQGIGAKPTAGVMSFLDGWGGREGVPQNVDAFNVLGTTQPMPGSHGTNSAGVQSYPNAQEGIAAAVRTLNGMPAIKQAILSGNPAAYANDPEVQKEMLAWSGGGYTWPSSSGGAPAVGAGPALSTAPAAADGGQVQAARQFLGQVLIGNLHAHGGDHLAALTQALEGVRNAEAGGQQPQAPSSAPNGVPATSTKGLKLAPVPDNFSTRPGVDVNQQILPSVLSVAKAFDVQVNSGYRSPEHNASVGGAENSDHLSGDAVDFTGSPANMKALYTWAQGKFPYVEPWDQTGGTHVHVSFLRAAKA